jgi:hypothetical protein
MENKERFTDRNEDMNRQRTENVEKINLDDDSMEGRDQPVDLDGDGMIGNTGGFYGGTSYVGSNYGADWNTENSSQHEGNYGAAGQQDATDLTNERAQREREEREERLKRGE